MPETRKQYSHAVRPGRDAVSAVRLSQELTAEIDAWAQARQLSRSDAIGQLLEFGLSATTATAVHTTARCKADIKDIAADAIERMLDPDLPADERDRRLRRLIEGPPEFLDQRIDLLRSQESPD